MLLLLTLTAVSHPDKEDVKAIIPLHRGIITGNVFIELDEASRAAYVSGYVDALLVGAAWGIAAGDSIDIAKVFEGRSGLQLRDVVDKYLRDHPESSHESMNLLTYNAFLKAWPEINDIW